MWTVSAYSVQGTVTEVVPAILKKTKESETTRKGKGNPKTSPDAHQEEVKTCLSFGELTRSLGTVPCISRVLVSSDN